MRYSIGMNNYINPHYYQKPKHDPYARKYGACVYCDMLPDNRVHR